METKVSHHKEETSEARRVEITETVRASRRREVRKEEIEISRHREARSRVRHILMTAKTVKIKVTQRRKRTNKRIIKILRTNQERSNNEKIRPNTGV